MSSFTVLRDLGDTLKYLLKANIDEITDEHAIVFDSPAEIEDTAGTTLSIFLYQIVENSYLRNSEPVAVGMDGLQRPPLTLDLYYLFTPYAKTREIEYIVLEKIMMLFHENAILDGDILQGQLTNSGNEQIRIIPQGFSFDEINKLWERFPNKPFKLSLSYQLTPVRIPSDKVFNAKRVREKIINMNLMS